MTLRQIDRFVLDVDVPPLVAYFNRCLRVPYSFPARVATHIPPAAKFLGQRIDALPDWAQLVRGTVPDARWIFMSDYPDSARRRFIGFAFRNGSPFAVVKVRVLAGGADALVRPNASLAHEAAAHEDVRRRVRAGILETIPRVIRFDTTPDAEILVLDVVRGRSAFVEMQAALVPARHVEAHFAAAADWLARFHDSNAGAHGDFWAQNVLLTGNAATGVVDWERYDVNGDPLADVFHFPLTYAMNYRWRATNEEAFAEAFLRRTPIARGVRQYFERYAAARKLALPHLRDRFREYLAAAPEEKLPWTRFAQAFNAARDSVFS